MNKFEFHFYTSFMRYFKDRLTNSFCDTPFLMGFKNDIPNTRTTTYNAILELMQELEKGDSNESNRFIK